jgi:hypothetical protein
MNFVAIKTPVQSDLLSLHRVRSRLVRRRRAIINQIRGFLIERGVAVRQGPGPLRKVLPELLSSPPEALSPRILRLIAELDEDWRRLDERTLFVPAPTLSSNGVPPRRGALSGPGSTRPPSASRIAICSRSPSPTSSHASPGPCSPVAATTSQGSRPMPHNIRSLRFTKGMDALPLHHPHSPILLDWASETHCSTGVTLEKW